MGYALHSGRGGRGVRLRGRETRGVGVLGLLSQVEMQPPIPITICVRAVPCLSMHVPCDTVTDHKLCRGLSSLDSRLLLLLTYLSPRRRGLGLGARASGGQRYTENTPTRALSALCDRARHPSPPAGAPPAQHRALRHYTIPGSFSFFQIHCTTYVKMLFLNKLLSQKKKKKKKNVQRVASGASTHAGLGPSPHRRVGVALRGIDIP